MKCIYKDFYLSAMSSPTNDGTFQARVAIATLNSLRTRAQQFLDLDVWATLEQANTRAIEGGKEWVDAQIRHEQQAAQSFFASFENAAD